MKAARLWWAARLLGVAVLALGFLVLPGCAFSLGDDDDYDRSERRPLVKVPRGEAPPR